MSTVVFNTGFQVSNIDVLECQRSDSPHLSGKNYHFATDVTVNAYQVAQESETRSCCCGLSTMLVRFFGRIHQPRVRYSRNAPNLETQSLLISSDNISGNSVRFYTERRDEAKQEYLSADRRLLIVEDPEMKAHTGEVVKFYHDPKNVWTTVRDPIRKGSKQELSQLRGLNKKAVAHDDEFIELTAVDGSLAVLAHHKEMSFEEWALRLDTIARALAPYPSCCPCVVIEGDKMLAKYGGKPLLNVKRPVNLNAFKQASFDLADMHKKSIYLRDIKSQNLTLHNNTTIMFVDIDDAAVPPLNNYRQDCASFTPERLNQDILHGRKKGDINALLAGDNYAMLITMMEITSDKRVLREALFTKYESDEKRVAPAKSLVTASNYHHFKDWVQRNMKPEYLDQVMAFLQDPMANPLPESLYDMMIWS